jgi:hypothetical protein
MSGGGNSAQKQADQNEADRQAKIAAATSGINQIFDNPARNAEYDKLGTDTTKYYTDDLSRQEAVQARKLKFALARSGLGGGSEQAYQGKVLGQDYDKGLIAATRAGNKAESDLKAQDEQSRMNLLGMAEAGLDSQTASSRATSALQNNLQAGNASATADTLGSAFSDFASLYQQSQDQKAARQGSIYGYGSIFQPLYGNQQQQSSGYGF